MKADLILKSSEQAETFALSGDRATVGRSINAHVRLSDQLVSREHCELLRLGDRFVVRDLGSSNGTFVNGTNITEKVLEWGDKILVGESVLIFVFDEKEGDSDTDLQVTDHDPAETQSMFLRKTDLDVSEASKEEAASEYLNLIYRAGDAILDKETLSEVSHALLEVLQQRRKFGRSAVLLFGARGEISERFSRAEGDPSRAPIRLEAGLLLKVFQDGESVFTKGRKIDDMVCSCMVVPVRGRDKVYGALYVDDLASMEELKEKELHLVAAIGHLVGLTFDRVVHFQNLQNDITQYRRMIASEMDLVGESEIMRNLVDQVRQGSLGEGPVLIQGERGTGKELVARLIHFHSDRSGQPFEAVELGSLASDQIAMELFGQEKGPSEVLVEHPGRLEIVRGGTIFLDGIEKLPLERQGALLEVIQKGNLRRVGGSIDIPVAARVLVGTTGDLSEQVQAGTFSKELFALFSDLTLYTPPLRVRVADIRVLARHFAFRFSREMGKRFLGFSREAELRLARHEWPGNVRELRNLVERVISVSESSEIGLDELSPWLPQKSDLPRS